MTLDGTIRLIDSLAKLLGILVWPAVAFYALIRFGKPIQDFIAHLAALTLKGGGFELSGTRTAEAAASLAAATLSHSDAPDSPVEKSRTARAAADTVAQIATPQVIRRAGESTVLWVDDKPTNNLNERQALEALGVRFVLATSTDEALAQVQQQQFDLIISDMGRPGDQQAGYTLLERLRAAGNLIPYIIYASSRAPEDIAEARRRTALGCTNRPTELFEMVLSVLGKR